MKWIQSVQNETVKQWKKLLQKKERDLTNQYMIEGFHLVEEACQYPSLLQSVMIREDLEIPNWLSAHSNLYQISSDVAKAISDTETNQGIFAICSKIEQKISETAQSFLLLDAIQDPGNLGTIIRTADAAGVHAIILGEGTVDAYNPKVIRSTQGSHFHVPILKGNLFEWVEKLKKEDVPIYGTALSHAKPYHQIEANTPFALILGNEGNGITPDLLEMADENLYVPIYGKSESLNVTIAGGILLYHFMNKVYQSE